MQSYADDATNFLLSRYNTVTTPRGRPLFFFCARPALLHVTCYVKVSPHLASPPREALYLLFSCFSADLCFLFLGQGEVKLQSAPLAVADAYAAAVEDDGVLDDGEPQSCASERPASSLVDAVEAVEYRKRRRTDCRVRHPDGLRA